MQRDRFVASRRARWEELEQLLARPPRLQTLEAADVLRLGELYRAATSDLAIARRDFPQDRVADYLNSLVARAHPLVYQQSPLDVSRLSAFVRYGFPAAYRAALPYTALSFGIFAMAALISALVVAVHPAAADVLLPGTAQQLRSVMEQHQLWMKGATSNSPVASNFIMLNNIRVAFAAFAGGILAGVITIYVMAYNGLAIGVIGAMVAQYGLSRPFWAFVLPHGVIELSVIFMAGGAGMMVGDAILGPGLERRRIAIAAAARRAVAVVVGCVPLLIIAGTIEGFFSPSDAPDGLKVAVGTVTGVLLYTYLLLSRPPTSGRRYTFEDVNVGASIVEGTAG